MEFAEAEEVHLRWTIKKDLDTILKIEAESFDDPWTKKDFLEAYRQRNCIGMTAEVGDHIVGFMLYELHRSKLNLLNLAVDGLCRRAQIGTQMIDRLKSKLSVGKRTHIATRVLETNLQGQQFLRSQGFKVTGADDSPFNEDAYVMKFEPFRKGLTVSLTNRITQHEGPLL